MCVFCTWVSSVKAGKLLRSSEIIVHMDCTICASGCTANAQPVRRKENFCIVAIGEMGKTDIQCIFVRIMMASKYRARKHRSVHAVPDEFKV